MAQAIANRQAAERRWVWSRAQSGLHSVHCPDGQAGRGCSRRWGSAAGIETFPTTRAGMRPFASLGVTIPSHCHS